MSSPVLIVLADYGSPASRANQEAIWQALNSEIIGRLGGRSVAPPCSGWRISLGACHARSDSACQKVLIVVGDDTSAPTAAVTRLCDEWAVGGNDHVILPIFPHTARRTVTQLLPASASAANAEFWMQLPRDSLPAIFARANITTDQPRLFISYRQRDSAALAIQLFDSLSHEGFDVFLDHFRIPPGVNFQSRLTQELGDKSMVLLLESEHLAESPWVMHEIATAKSCGLGLLGLLLPAGQPQESLLAARRPE